MKGSRLVLLGMALATSPLAAQEQAAPDSAVARASAAALEWVALVDSAKYAESWETAHEAFRSAVQRADWVGQMGQVRAPLGPASGRELLEARYTTDLPNAPPGEYVLIQYRTNFAQLAGAIETVVPMKAPDGSWRVSGYFIRPPR